MVIQIWGQIVKKFKIIVLHFIWNFSKLFWIFLKKIQILKKNQNTIINTNKDVKPILPYISYTNPDTQKVDILKNNKKKTGIYKWTNVVSGKSYVGSAIDLSRRYINYYNISYLETEIKKIIVWYIKHC